LMNLAGSFDVFAFVVVQGGSLARRSCCCVGFGARLFTSLVSGRLKYCGKIDILSSFFHVPPCDFNS
ncbi:hypothetical protein LIP39_10585, partial [Bifidobacterium breve]|uniref:hypothetical protein n=1 Tax=Bifidobacterium breve TaxID=1685 RepID=UPI001D013131